MNSCLAAKHLTAACARQRLFRTAAPLKGPLSALPGTAAFAGLAILAFGTLHHTGRVALGLATATLMVAGIRLALSARSLRTLTAKRYRQSVTDELTSLGNRRHLLQILDAFFADEVGAPTPDRSLAFLFVDLDHFKEVNDAFGHTAGDQVLKQLSARLKAALRRTDELFRLGGDEFAVVLTGADAEYATTIAAQLTASLQEPFVLEAISARISASIGIAHAPADATDSAGLMWCADVAMYRAKNEDLPFAVFGHEQDVDGRGNYLRLAEELREAIQDGHLVLHYQPLLDLRSGEVSAVEALVRWPHPRLGLIPPLTFLPVAEEAGLMGTLTKWVLEEALEQCAAWRVASRRMRRPPGCPAGDGHASNAPGRRVHVGVQVVGQAGRFLGFAQPVASGAPSSARKDRAQRFTSWPRR